MFCCDGDALSTYSILYNYALENLTKVVSRKIDSLISDINILKSHYAHVGALEATIEDLRKDETNLLKKRRIT